MKTNNHTVDIGVGLAHQHYTASSISVLSELDAVRKNPGMYIGAVDINGLHQLAYELIDNSIDEVIGGFCNSLRVVLHKDGSCTIEDNGRGIPVDVHPELGKSACEIVLTTLHSGGKFHTGVYYKTAGLHGVGLSCVNALSQWLNIEIWRDAYCYNQQYRQGKPVVELTKVPCNGKRGTRIRFLPDPEIFGSEITMSCAVLKKRLNELAFLHPNLKIEFTSEHDNETSTFVYETGILGFIEDMSKAFDKVHETPLCITSTDSLTEFELVLQWTTSYEENVLSYVNSVNTAYGGTHEAAMRTAITDAINRYAEEHKLLQVDTDPQITSFDVFEGLICVFSVKMSNPVFEGQTKAKLTNEATYDELYDTIYKKFSVLLHTHSQLALLVVKRALNASKARLAARRASESISYQRLEVKISEEVYQKQFGIRSKNWHDSACWLTDEELLLKHVDHLDVNEDCIALDVCCGSGVVGAAFKPKVKKIIGLDLTPEMIELAKQRLDEVHQGTIYNLPFEDNFFDLVVTREVLHLLPNPGKPVSEIFRVLKPGGQFIVGQTLPFGHGDGPWMYRIFKKKQPLVFNMFQEEDFRELLLGAGFVDLKLSEINVWESIDMWINTHETTVLHRHEIKELFYNAPQEAKEIHPFKILPSGEIHDLWRWGIFSVKKPQTSHVRLTEGDNL